MAIIEELGVGVSIYVDGQPTPEYDDPNPIVNEEGDYAICSKYVESADDAEYKIRYDCLPEQRWLYDNPENRLTFRLYIDGTERCAHSVNRNLVLYGEGSIIVEGAESFRGHGKPIGLSKFRFSAVTPVEDADHYTIEADKERAETLGVISVEVWRVVQKRQESTVPDDIDEEDRNTSEMAIAEKALRGKAVSHGTSFSPAVEAEAQFLFDLGDVDDYPLAIFHMKYRSKEALRQELIVPRTPRPGDGPSSPVDLRSRSPTPDNYPVVEELNHDELLRLAKERLVAIKKENQTAVKKELDGVELELDSTAPRLALKIIRQGGGPEMIDLTDD